MQHTYFSVPALNGSHHFLRDPLICYYGSSAPAIDTTLRHLLTLMYIILCAPDIQVFRKIDSAAVTILMQEQKSACL
jgi:hypothetical protein